ncbi:MAG: D-alanine--D-alanine ligase [Myxococcales bacterium]|nr:D-alanine--D-alanine ligase [Myxococcales bacterium]
MKKRVGVIMGGPSAEREVALASGRRVAEALAERGHSVASLDWTGADQNLWADLRRERVEVAFVALHGTLGEDGCIQGLLECAGIPYTGSGVLASALAMDKVASRRVFMEESIETPRWTVYQGPADVARVGLPLVVKPSREGSSVGITFVRDESQLDPALQLAQRLHGVVLLEELVVGREIEVAVLDGVVLGDVEIRPAGEFYDYAAKYQRTDTQYSVPAPLSAAERQLCHDLARRAHLALGCAGVTRTDLLLSSSGRAVCLEIDTLPGLTDRSLVPKIAAQAGLDFPSLCERILATAALKA